MRVIKEAAGKETSTLIDQLFIALLCRFLPNPYLKGKLFYALFLKLFSAPLQFTSIRCLVYRSQSRLVLSTSSTVIVLRAANVFIGKTAVRKPRVVFLTLRFIYCTYPTDVLANFTIFTVLVLFQYVLSTANRSV